MKKWLVVAGQLLAFVSLLILAGYQNYTLLLLIQVLFGLGCGTYHSYLLRDANFWGIMSFIPLYAFNVVGLSKAASAAIVALFPFMGLFANVAGGFLGDRLGAVRVAVLSIFHSAPESFRIT